MDPQKALLKKAIDSSRNREDVDRERNAYSPFIEAITSPDRELLNRVNGEYRILIGYPESHPDTVLTAARTAAEEEKTLPPCAASLLSRSAVLGDYNLLYDSSKRGKKIVIRQTIAIHPPQFERSPLESLTPVLLPDMMLHKVHKGNYLICRTISRAVHMVAVQAAIEDQAGNVAELALYNCFETAGLNRDGVAGMLPIGQVILVREPWFKLGTTGGSPTVRVDAPSDIKLLEFNHPMLQDLPESWKAAPSQDVEGYRLLGNQAFKNNHLEAAVRAYTTGLAIDPSASLLRLNRSLCYLKLGSLSLAVNDARTASDDETLPALSRYKARYRMAAAFYAMDRFSEALDILEEDIDEFSPTDVQTLRKKSRDRLLEQTQGNYDWFALSKLAKEINGRQPIPDVADYIGPVKVAPMVDIGGGRGLIATRPIKAGELLLVSKPFAFASPLEYPDLLRALNLERGNITERAQYEVIGRAARRLMGDHTAAGALFLDLHPGQDYHSVSCVAANPPPPTFLINGAQHWLIPGEHSIADIDINKVEGIIASNSFSDDIEDCDLGKTEAVYSLPSLMNHSCHGTAVRFHMGSVVIVRASRDMDEGEEITCSYVGIGDHVGGTYLTRKPMLKKWIDDCHCILCSSDRLDGDSMCQEREKYGAEVGELMDRHPNPADPQFARAIRALIPKIQSTYRKGRNEPMNTLGLAQQGLAFVSQLRPEQTVQAYIAMLRAYGVGVKDMPPKVIPRNRSGMKKGALIIRTNSFPSQANTIWKCIKTMQSLASFQSKHGKHDMASHWAVACLWTHETFYGPGKDYLWFTLPIRDPSCSRIAQILENFE